MAASSYQQKERRKFLRIKESHLVDLGIFSLDELTPAQRKFMKTFTKDISVGGILFESDQIYDFGTLLRVSLSLPGWEKFLHEFYKGENRPTAEKPLVAVGKVVRIEDIGNGRYDIGVCFCALDESRKRAVKQYLEQGRHS